MVTGSQLTSAPIPHPPLRGRRLLAVAGFWAIVIPLLGFDAWWLERDLRPAPSLHVVSDWVRQNRLAEAESALAERLWHSRRDGQALIMLAGVRAARGDMLGAARRLHEVPRWWPNKSDLLAMEGRLYIDSGRARDAEHAWRRCLEGDPLHPPSANSNATVESARALVDLCILERRLGEASDALASVWERLSPDNRTALLETSLRAMLNPGPSASDAPRLRRYVAADRDDWHARRALALAAQALGERHEAFRLIEECRRARPADPLVWRDWLAILRDQGQIDRFVVEASQIPREIAGRSELCHLRGIARQQTGDWVGAAAALREAVKQDAADAETYARLAEVERQLGHNAEAEQAAKRSRRIISAREELRSALDDLAQLNRAGAHAASARVEVLERLAVACDQLGWTRESDLWVSIGPAQ